MEINEGSSTCRFQRWKEVRNRFESILICVIHRNDQSFIPDGDFHWKKATMYLLQGAYPDLRNFLKINRLKKRRVCLSATIVGVDVLLITTNMLKQTKINTKVTEANEERCET